MLDFFQTNDVRHPFFLEMLSVEPLMMVSNLRFRRVIVLMLATVRRFFTPAMSQRLNENSVFK